MMAAGKRWLGRQKYHEPAAIMDVLRYYERRVPKANSKPLPLYRWLLCALILIASVDRVPDPPVVKPHQDKAATLCFSSHQLATDQNRTLDRVLFDPSRQVRFVDWSFLSESKPPLPCTTYRSQASDSSPPASLL